MDSAPFYARKMAMTLSEKVNCIVDGRRHYLVEGPGDYLLERYEENMTEVYVWAGVGGPHSEVTRPSASWTAGWG